MDLESILVKSNRLLQEKKILSFCQAASILSLPVNVVKRLFQDNVSAFGGEPLYYLSGERNNAIISSVVSAQAKESVLRELSSVYSCHVWGFKTENYCSHEHEFFMSDIPSSIGIRSNDVRASIVPPISSSTRKNTNSWDNLFDVIGPNTISDKPVWIRNKKTNCTYRRRKVARSLNNPRAVTPSSNDEVAENALHAVSTNIPSFMNKPDDENHFQMLSTSSDSKLDRPGRFSRLFSSLDLQEPDRAHNAS
ncbi:Oidioi.mRNA.OKI2018_I69.chr2.g7145.t1.cds [Oikopleura dioica]|uniref:Oidioi.mRNA.OKI2018_I69.chr2.g7145.t1.cds n=1 Tax=Oikopleura dioica TaxID=34765 RepID=A0ABN7T5W5_OIKDI|nr:Oidioi.mRNA.OKI2018_I69.chr2.g7145.t1.cds [Oikopleura dioica]